MHEREAANKKAVSLLKIACKKQEKTGIKILEMAKFKHGQSGNEKGRPVGATNKIVKPVKELLSDFLNRKVLELNSIWPKLSPRDQIGVLRDIYPFFIARMEAVSIDLNVKKLSDSEVTELIERVFKTKSDD